MITLAKSSATTSSSRWLWLVLFVTLALTMWTALSPQSEDDDLLALAEPSSPPAEAASSASQNARTEANMTQANTVQTSAPDTGSTTSASWLQALTRQAPQADYVNLFKVHSWVVAAPSISSKAKPLPPPKPTAPPAPFSYMGKLEDGPNGSKVFLMANNRVYAVAIGENITPFWRLDGEDENSVQLTYLPLHLPQILSKNTQSNSPNAATTGALDSR